MTNFHYGKSLSSNLIASHLEILDSKLLKFVSEKGLPKPHNTSRWPNREIRWMYQIERLIEVYLERDEKTWTLWVCAYNYENSIRRRKKQDILKAISFEEMKAQLAEKLEEAYDLVCSWDEGNLTKVD